jgi:preprotein translocase subunit SecE
VNYSIVVLITLIILTTFIGVLDWALGEGLLKLFER